MPGWNTIIKVALLGLGGAIAKSSYDAHKREQSVKTWWKKCFSGV